MRTAQRVSHCAARPIAPKALDGGDAESAGLGDDADWRALTGHMSRSHAGFLARWLRLVELEESRARSARPGLWAEPGPTRAAPGTCMPWLRLVVGGSGATHCRSGGALPRAT
jgi:hypothetical protein